MRGHLIDHSDDYYVLDEILALESWVIVPIIVFRQILELLDLTGHEEILTLSTYKHDLGVFCPYHKRIRTFIDSSAQLITNPCFTTLRIMMSTG